MLSHLLHKFHAFYFNDFELGAFRAEPCVKKDSDTNSPRNTRPAAFLSEGPVTPQGSCLLSPVRSVAMAAQAAVPRGPSLQGATRTHSKMPFLSRSVCRVRSSLREPASIPLWRSPGDSVEGDPCLSPASPFRGVRPYPSPRRPHRAGGLQSAVRAGKARLTGRLPSGLQITGDTVEWPCCRPRPPRHPLCSLSRTGACSPTDI